jgi:putative DNA primase/helicase
VGEKLFDPSQNWREQAEAMIKAHKANGHDTSGGKRIELVRIRDIKPESADWLWKHWIARKKLQLIAGNPAGGKSTIAFSFAATTSRGGAWPDGTPAKQGNVLIWSGEDGVADTIVPRLLAMGADPDHVFIISTVTKDGVKRPFNPADDLTDLEAEIKKIDGGIDLLIIDPLVSAKQGKLKNPDLNIDMRQGLQHVVDFAEKHNCAVIGIHHLAKASIGNEPTLRVLGSVAISAVARIILMAVKQQGELKKDAPPRMLVRAKSNLGPDGGGFGYDIQAAHLTEPAVETSQIKWLGKIDGEARDLVAGAEETPKRDGDSKQATAKAVAFLLEMLKDGPVPSNEAKQRMLDADHSIRSIKNAKKELNVKSVKPSTVDGPWTWRLPREDEDPF